VQSDGEPTERNQLGFSKTLLLDNLNQHGCQVIFTSPNHIVQGFVPFVEINFLTLPPQSPFVPQTGKGKS
jgi:hypothetical protein